MIESWYLLVVVVVFAAKLPTTALFYDSLARRGGLLAGVPAALARRPGATQVDDNVHHRALPREVASASWHCQAQFGQPGAVFLDPFGFMAGLGKEQASLHEICMVDFNQRDP